MVAPMVFSYMRFSDAKQAGGDSAGRQTMYAKRWAAEHGLQLDENLSMRDEGLSAYHQKHVKSGALGVFLAAINAGRIPPGSVLIVEGLDRLSRAEPILAQAQLAQIINADITVVTASDGKHYNREGLKANPMDLVYSLLTMIRAHEESETKSKRVKASVRRQCEDWISGKRRERIVNGRDPGWVRWNGEKFEHIPERAEAMRMVIRLFLEGHGYVRIKKALEENNLVVTGENSTNWIYTLIQRPDLIGARLLKSDGEQFRLEDYYPRLISDEDFARLQLEYSRRKATPRAPGGKSRFPGLFTGLSVGTCGQCGLKLISQNHTRTTTTGEPSIYRRLLCQKCSPLSSQAGSASARVIENAILDYCSDQMNLDALLTPQGNVENLHVKRAALSEKIAMLEAKSQAILDASLESDDGLPQIVIARLRKMEAEITEARAAADLLAAEGVVRANPENATTAAVWASLSAGVRQLDYDSRIKCRKVIGDTFSAIQVYFRGAYPGTPENIIDVMLVSKTGVSRLLRIDRKTGKFVSGLNLDQNAA